MMKGNVKPNRIGDRGTEMSAKNKVRLLRIEEIRKELEQLMPGCLKDAGKSWFWALEWASTNAELSNGMPICRIQVRNTVSNIKGEEDQCFHMNVHELPDI